MNRLKINIKIKKELKNKVYKTKIRNKIKIERIALLVNNNKGNLIQINHYQYQKEIVNHLGLEVILRILRIIISKFQLFMKNYMLIA